MIQVAGMALVVVSAVLAWAVCLLYHLSAPWWRSESGRHVMTFTAVLALVLSLWAFRVLVPAEGHWWDVVRLIAFTGVPASLGWRLWLLYRLQVQPGLKKHEERQ